MTRRGWWPLPVPVRADHQEVFGTDRTGDGLPGFDFAVCSPGAAAVTTTSGFALHPSHGLNRLVSADLVVVPALPRVTAPEVVLDALRGAVARGARVLSVCSGAFVLGEAGLLDGRCCTTHWKYTAELAARFPAARIDADVLYVEDGPVITSAGTAAGIDACLHLMRQEFGVTVATTLARRMVVPPHRDGGQAQYVETPVPVQAAQSLQSLLDWVCAHLDQEHTVETLAARALMSPRTFARRLKTETGTTPYAWLNARRVELAQSLLEQTDEPVERVAMLTRFGGPAALRHHFAATVRTTPQRYRRVFRTPQAGLGASGGGTPMTDSPRHSAGALSMARRRPRCRPVPQRRSPAAADPGRCRRAALVGSRHGRGLRSPGRGGVRVGGTPTSWSSRRGFAVEKGQARWISYSRREGWC